MNGLNLTLKETVKALGLEPRSEWEDIVFSGVSTDTRILEAGQLFVALKGPRFDGHEFIDTAFKKGASAILAERESFSPGRICLTVDDSLRALGDLAAYVRRRRPLKVVAVTGTNGKTTTREMIVSILGRRFRVLASKANYNNLVGLPLTLLNLEPSHQLAVLEMGMNSPGEIGRLTEIADPDVALITNIGPAHLEGVGSLEGVAGAKGELFQGIKPEATAIINADDPLVAQLAARLEVRGLSFGFSRKSDVRAQGLRYRGLKGLSFKLKTSSGNVKIELPLFGRHNASNALAAAATAVAMKMAPVYIKEALDEIEPFPGRLELKMLPGPVYLLDDTYNANPVSVKASLEVLMKTRGRGRAVAVLGDMLELGRETQFEHARIGRTAAQFGVDFLVGVGPLAKTMLQSSIRYGLAKKQTAWFEAPGQAAEWLEDQLQVRDRILIKGSRGMRMERIVQHLRERNQDQE